MEQLSPVYIDGTGQFIQNSLQRFFNRNERRFCLHFSYEEFKSRYAREAPEGNPFRNAELLKEMENDWVRSVDLANVKVHIEEVKSEKVSKTSNDSGNRKARPRMEGSSKEV